MPDLVICRFGSGVQELAEQINGSSYCLEHCGKGKGHMGLSDPGQSHICEGYARAWQEKRNKKADPEACNQ